MTTTARTVSLLSEQPELAVWMDLAREELLERGDDAEKRFATATVSEVPIWGIMKFEKVKAFA